MFRVVAATAAFLLALASTSADKLEQHSFEPPYTDVDPSGNRLLSKDWKNGGVASVSQSFVRLTPDRQSKKGAVWSRKSLGTDTFSTILKFRISGQGKKFFGDGMALWVMQQAYFVEGDLHGSVERFTGFGVIFDTFKNTESLSQHRDVSVIVNDGESSTELMMDKLEGCDASIRYHEDRADFSVESMSRAKVIVTGKRLVVQIDGKNDGQFKDCAVVDLPFAMDWAKSAHIGVTASTGQLADNHDVISLTTFSDLVKHEQSEALVLSTPSFEKGDGISQERFERIEDTMSKILDKLEYLEHHTEHELMAVEDHIKVSTSKLQAQEAISEGRIDELETKVVSNINGGIEKRRKSRRAQARAPGVRGCV
mmetsp:Transcript_44902/g.123052  ORF Transcript_44902/g.123052 Transcript_44902/m.123052 type:complete len:368 (-) Transcript_44902:860-1963(-)